jgi:hypothetical protein
MLLICWAQVAGSASPLFEGLVLVVAQLVN